MENNILNNSYVIGVGTRNLVLNTLGRVYVRVQEKYYELNFKDSSTTGIGYGGVIVVETDAQALSLTYPGDNILILSKEGNIYYTQNGTINLFGLDVNNLIDPVITGTLTINNGDKTPIVIQNPILCSNLNAEFLNGYTYDQFAIKEINEQILGEWTFTTDTFIETQLINDSTNTYLDFENSRLVIDYIDVRKGITGINVVLPDPLIELDENDHLHPVDEAWGFYTEQFISCRGLDVEASGSIGYATEAFVQQSIADLVNGAPETLDTLGEIAAMLSQNDSLLDSLNALLNTHTSQLTTLFSYFDGDAAKKAVKLRDITKLWGNDFDGTQKNIDGTLWFNNGSYLMPTNIGYLNTNVGFYSDSFISCRGLDPSASTAGGSNVAILPSSKLNSNFLDTDTTSTFNAFTIKSLSTRIAILENNSGGDSGITSETDPIFKASAAYGITSTNISNWNSAYNWGNHASAGYLLKTGGTITGDLTVIGTITGQIDVVGGSDIRYKTIIDKIDITSKVLDEIIDAPLFNFKWNNCFDDKLHLGTSAQYWKNTIFKNTVCYDSDKDFNYLSYQTLAFGIGKVNSHVLKLHDIQLSAQDKRIIELEEKVTELENKLHKYGFE